ncbi:L-threonylcarbamoyladenylate synthase [bacterium]|nr:L-threonylcarbamoyladenylate synthase [bacterium]
MKGEPLLCLEDNPAEAVARAQAAIRGGGTVVFPTDTVYGLLAGVDSPAAYREIYELKMRPAGKPMALLIASGSTLVKEAVKVLAPFESEAKQFLSGELTIVLSSDKLASLPGSVARVQPGPVGMRIPAHRYLQELLAAAGGMLWATSANRSGGPPASTAAMVEAWLESLDEPPTLVVLARTPLEGTASSVVELRGGRLIHVRQAHGDEQ